MKQLILLLTLISLPSRSAAQAVTLDGFWNLTVYGNDTTYMSGLASRTVNGELRFLSLTHNCQVFEYRLGTTPMGGTIAGVTARWNIGSAIGTCQGRFTSLFYDDASQRLFVTQAVDYTATAALAWIKTMTLGAAGAVTNVHTVTVGNVQRKRMYGGCRLIPAQHQAALGGPLACGFGGYTSLMDQGGGAALGPTLYVLPDPSTVPNGVTVQAKVVLDAFVANTRGTRATTPLNYYDGGDPRQNPSTAPINPPVSTARWLSPDSQGRNWMVWGDSYYGNAAFIDSAFVLIAAVCQGKCWYGSSTLHSDTRSQELHGWNIASLTGANKAQRPDSMRQLNLPRGVMSGTTGNGPPGNVSGLTFDAASRKLYAVIFPAGTTDKIGRLYQFSVAPADADAVVSPWAMQSCSETQTQVWTRTVITPPVGNGTTPPLSETRTVTGTCD